MDHQTQEQIKEIVNFLQQSKFRHQRLDNQLSSNLSEISWDASRFWGTVLYKAKPARRYLTLDALKTFARQYESEHKVAVNEEELLARFWLRNVLGYISVARGIDLLCYTFNEIKHFKQELLFWIAFEQTHKNKKIDKQTLTSAIQEYEQAHSITLQSEGVYCRKWVNPKDEGIEVSEITIYYQSFITYWSEFSFLLALKEFRNEVQNRQMSISANEFDALLFSYGTLYDKAPSLATLIDSGIITKGESSYWIDPSKIEEGLWSKVSGYSWELTATDVGFSDDQTRIIHWIIKCVGSERWPNHLIYSTPIASRRFLAGATALLLQEPDLDHIENEHAKIRLDDWHGHHVAATLNSAAEKERFPLNNKDHFELLHSLLVWKNKGHENGLIIQEARNFLSFLALTVTRHEPEATRHFDANGKITQIVHYEQLVALLKAGLNKPYLLWQVTQDILRERQEVLPYILITDDLRTIAFILIDELEFANDLFNQSNHFLWEKSATLFLRGLNRADVSSIAEKILQLYRQLNCTKYQLPFNPPDAHKALIQRDSHSKKEKIILALIENIPKYPYLVQPATATYFFPQLLNELASAFIHFTATAYFRNGTVEFPIMQWDGLSWLLRASTYWKFKEQAALMRESVGDIASHFLRSYISTIQIAEITKYNYFEEKEEKGLPLWSEKIERLTFIEWIYPVYFIHQQGALGRFLNPDLPFEKTDDIYHEGNLFTADKLRTHIGVLLQILKQLVLPAIPYGFEKATLSVIKSKIEEQINDFLKRHAKNDPEQRRADLFTYGKEYQFHGTDGEALFPQIARALNWFSDKDALINAISESGDIDKMLTLLDWVTSEGIRQQLLTKIQTLDVKPCLEKSHWIPEIQYTLVKLTRYPALIGQIEDAIRFWKEQILTKKKSTDYEMVLFRAQLLVAYFQKDEAGIEAIEEPTNQHLHQDVSVFTYKQFYRGLLLIETEPEKAHGVFNSLVQQYPTYVSFALNRLVAKNNWAKINGNTNLYREALEEWNGSNFSQKALDNIQPNLAVNLLTIYHALEEHVKFDTLYSNLDIEYKMEPDILKIVVESLVARKRIDEALQITTQAKSYHEFSGFKNIQLVLDLLLLVNAVDNVAELQAHYLRIYASNPEKLIRIFPENLNGKTNLTHFLVQEFVLSVDKLLEKIQSIGEIRVENKYNDIVEIVLNARINPWGWRVAAQSRGAFPGTGGKEPGERDLPVVSINNVVLINCEAWIFRDAARTKAHLTKIFDYYHKREDLLVLVYDTGENGPDFDENWKKYIETIVPIVTYPSGFEIKGNPSEVSKNYGFGRSGIKIATTTHGAGTTIHHIFVHINYKVVASVVSPKRTKKSPRKGR